MKFAKPPCRGRQAANAQQDERRDLRQREAEVLCLESGSEFLDVLFTFTAFLLVFAIGLGFGFLAKGP
jgi:hypothetical protein